MAMWDALQSDVWLPLLEPLGESLGPAMAASKAWTTAAASGDGLAFKPLLSNLYAAPSPAQFVAPRSKQADVARSRRSPHQGGWRTLAQIASRPASLPSSWRIVDTEGDTELSQRHSMAVCGGPSGVEDADYAVLFGGNISRSVAGSWRCTADLTLAKLPKTAWGGIELQVLQGKAGAAWPSNRWGATLTALSSACYLWGGWSESDDRSGLWTLHLREGGPQWIRSSSSSSSSSSGEEPPPASFHTATALEDGKRMAVLGGLGEVGSNRGVWLYHTDNGRWSAPNDQDAGPSCAGHAAGVVGHELAVFGGVARTNAPIPIFDDEFGKVTSLFDLRMERWLSATGSAEMPPPRRNPSYFTFGNHLIISGGWEDMESRCLTDTWALHVPSRRWLQMDCAGGPRLEAHKAVVSGFDCFTFGGHTAPSVYPSASMSIHCLALGLPPPLHQHDPGNVASQSGRAGNAIDPSR